MSAWRCQIPVARLGRLCRMGSAALLLCMSAITSMSAVAAEEEAAVNVGDTVFVDVYRRPELSSTVQVDANGNVSIPYVGNVNVAGVTEKEAAARVSTALQTILKSPQVTVSHAQNRTTVATPRAADMKTQVVTLNNASAESIAKSLSAMSSHGGSVSFDRNSNTLIVTDTPGAIQSIVSAVTQIDQMQTQLTQVRIETKLAEVKQGAMKDLGIRWFVKEKEITGGYYPATQGEIPLNGIIDPLANERVNGGSSSATGQASGSGRQFVEQPQFDRRLALPVQVPVVGQMFFGLLNNHVDIGSLLDALVKDQKAELLATPMTLAVNHRPAEIKMTDEYPYTESSQTFGGTSFSVKFMDLGIKLMVTPHVYRDTIGPYVQLDLKPEVSFSSGVANGIPIRSVRSESNTANVRDGQTLVIGGIVLNDEHNVNQGVPILGKVPVLGVLFKRKERSRTRNELMVFVTPTIHETPESITWDRMINLTGAAKTELPVLGKPGIPAKEVRGETRKE